MSRFLALLVIGLNCWLLFELVAVYYWTPNNLLKTYFEWRRGEHYYA